MLNFLWGAKKQNINNIFFTGVIIELVYFVLFSVEPLKKIFHDDNIVLRNNMVFMLVIFTLLAQIALYIFAARQADDQNRIKTILFFSCLFTLTLIFIWPIASNDLFTYIYQARIFSHFQANPYFISYGSLPGDEFYYLINNGWSSLTSLYGPFINLFNSALTRIAGNNFVLTVLLFKTAGGLLHLANGLLIYKITDSARSVMLYLWNPFILFELIVNGHNETYIIFFILLAIYLLKINKKHPLFPGLPLLALFFTVLIKAYTLVLLPVFALVQLKYLPALKQKIYFMVSASLMIGLFSFIFYFPYWQGIDTLSRPFSHANFVFAKIIYSSIFIMIFTTIFCIAGLADYTRLGYLSGRIAFIFFYLILIYAIIKSKLEKKLFEEMIKYLIICLIIFFTTFFNWLMPWYYTILIALIILYHKTSGKPLWKYAIYGLSILGILYYIDLR